MVLSEMVAWRRNQSDDGKLLGDDTLMAPEPLCGGMSIEHCSLPRQCGASSS